ncbi:MAG: hypothetical protein HN742_14335 [Lentisphaerae bacterium]|jgi:biopolymer transport protein ExbD|nr:hypothetical protein [Lentisphaerota bacterium]MBT4814459.1 hypothetical protein [Lentisphaerota bacterium]MBT5608721.1 hypothetical protein [Lentisphaerota bacterium]MBT7062165.1 hypothetical protein [Lentisphaerota bacterium]MBT7843053.1 hypothetical protein [Lentisphaerota bacterium]
MKAGARFSGNGVEGMLDVVLGCTLVFMLMTGLVNVEQGTGQEVTLPKIDLSKAQGGGNGATETRRTTVSLAMEGGTPAAWIGKDRVALPDLPALLAERGKGGVHVGLRRAIDVPCGIEDQVMIACRDAGVQQMAIIVEAQANGTVDTTP